MAKRSRLNEHIRCSDASRSSIVEDEAYVSQVLLEKEPISGGSRCQAFPQLVALRSLVGMWRRKQALSKHFLDQPHFPRATALKYLREQNLPLQNAAWSDLQGFSTSPADMLNVICQALKEAVNKIDSKGTFMKCMATFGSAVDLTCGNPSGQLAIGLGIISHDRPEQLETSLAYACSLASHAGWAVLVAYTATTTTTRKKYQDLKGRFPAVIFEKGRQGIVQNRLVLERMAVKHQISFLYSLDDDVKSLCVSLGRFDTVLGNNFGVGDLDLLCWFLSVVARSCDFAGTQATPNKGFGRLVVDDLSVKATYCNGGCFGYNLKALRLATLHIEEIGVGEDVVRSLMLSWHAREYGLRCLRWNMLVAKYGPCFAAGGMHNESRVVTQSYWLRILHDKLTPSVTGPLTWKPTMQVFNLKLGRQYPAELHATFQQRLGQASKAFSNTSIQTMKKWYTAARRSEL